MKYPFNIIDENEHLYAIDKPKGLVVNRAESQNQKVLADYTEQLLKIKTPKDISKLTRDEQEFYLKQGIVHRLDKETSGIILVAKNPDSYVLLKKQFLKKKVKKTYSLIVFNEITHLLDNHQFLKVNLPIGRDPTNRSKYAVTKEGRSAITNFYQNTSYNDIKISPVVKFGEFNFSFLTAKPITGRTHQIRVHSKALNCEVLGDTMYCGRKQIAFFKKYNIPLMLHAKKLEILGYTFESDYPKEFKQTVKLLWGL